MSKEKPEIGDIWINEENKAKIVILDYNPMSKEFIGLNQQTKNMRTFNDSDNMPRQFRYHGKSKANIEELFDIIPELTAKDVRKLMDLSSCGLLDCKRALIKCKGDIQSALKYLKRN